MVAQSSSAQNSPQIPDGDKIKSQVRFLDIYNNSIANSAEFERLFAENKNFVQLIQFKCLHNTII